MLENPFTPSFGEVPAHLAGRRQIVADFKRAFSSERRRPELTTLFSGARGTGKTALLSVLAQIAESNGWISVSTTALPGMLDDIEIGLRRQAAHLLPEANGKRVSNVGVATIGSISFENAPEPKTNWRYRMSEVLDQLKESDAGLVITVDEIDPSLPEMIELAAIYQHFIRDGYKVSLLMAGLPHNVSALLNDKTVSFLRRAQRYKLGRIADFEVADALRRTILENGRRADEQGLEAAVASIGGFPFLMQLVGFRSWDENADEEEISSEDFSYGIAAARSELEDRILDATLGELSSADIQFLRAMLEDEADSRVSDISQRLGWSAAQVGQYRRRLIDAGVIGERARGVVGFDMPYFREYLAGKVC